MKDIDESKYGEWLSVVANTRLIFNTMDELENYLDNHNISTNGMKRSYASHQKMRSAFNDLYMNVKNVTNGYFELDMLLKDYEKASNFYKKRLSRKKMPEKIIADILSYNYPPHETKDITKSMIDILKEIDEENIDIPILILLLMNVLSGYDSKDGDVKDFAVQYIKVMDLLNDFTKNRLFFDTIPAITQARHEENKNRLTLLYHTDVILNIYDSYNTEGGVYEMSEIIKEGRINLDIEGFWNESGGKPDRTDFWYIEKTLEKGVFFLTLFNKKSDNKIEMLRYSMITAEGDDGRLIVYLLHPKFIKHLVHNVSLDASDHTWYRTDMPLERNNVDNLLLRNTIVSEAGWKPIINLTKVSDEKDIKNYEDLLDGCDIINKYEDLEYEFVICLHAITEDALYIDAEEDNTYYKVPVNLHEGLEKIKISDRVGKIYIGKDIYLAFDDLMYYMPVKRTNKNVTIVDSIE